MGFVFLSALWLVACSSGVNEGGRSATVRASLVQTGVLGQISSGTAHACALTGRSEVVCWGEGDNGRLGNGDSSFADREHAVTVVEAIGGTSPLGGIVQISAGGGHTCALTSLGGVVCWGEGGNGRLGNGDASGADKAYPVAVVAAADSTAPLGDIVQISAGGAHTCALTSRGGVVCWGEGSGGELGDGDTLPKNTPVAVVGSEDGTEPLVNIVQISAGEAHTCALTGRGEVVCWGDGGSARLGNGDPSNENKSHPVAVVAADGGSGLLRDIVQLDSGGSHSCAVASSGRVVCWGAGLNGQLGNDTVVAESAPMTVVNGSGDTNPLEEIVQISAGDFHTCARTSGEEVRCWGKGTEGQLGSDDSTDKDHPVAVVEEDGSANPLGDIVQVSSGGDYTCILSFGGSVFCWGSGADGRLGNGGTDDKDHPVAVVDGSERLLRLGIRNLFWGCYDTGTCRRLGSTRFYQSDGEGVWGQIRSGGEHTCALTSSGRVLCWGRGAEGQLGNDGLADKDHPVEVVDGDGSTVPLEDIVQLSTGNDHTCALTEDGEVRCWGLGAAGQLGNDGTDNRDHPVSVVEASGSTNPLGDIIQISSKGNHVCAVTSSRGVVCWGQGTGGELGNNDILDKAHPVEVAEENGGTGLLADIVRVNSGWSHTCALKSEGEVVCWGNGGSGQLGNNGTDDSSGPVTVVEGSGSSHPLRDIVQISSGKEHTCALTVHGRVLCWGRGAEGQLGDNHTEDKHVPVAVAAGDGSAETLSGIVRISAGYEHTCALTDEGEVLCWGNGAGGQLGNGDTQNSIYPVSVLSEDIVEISPGREHTCALTSSGSVLCWGSGANGRLGNDGTDNEYAPVAVVEGDGGAWPLRLGVHRRSWACYRDGTCQEEPLPEFYENDGGAFWVSLRWGNITPAL